ncbi:MAG: hypothetical protein C5B48_14975 [Candidatus Rokuibacteriota bacterium]|nr:MAG: hypothetical protein C5B48_14975 [Candidatus Rokubacteria bacterium]
MSTVAIKRATRTLTIDGNPVFPIVLTNPPPPGAKAPSGRDALSELAAGGASFIRTGRPDWSLQSVDEQLAAERARLDAAASHGLHCWPWLGDVPNLPPAGATPSAKEQLLVKIVNDLKGHPALGLWKGVDEPANPGPGRIPAAGLVRAYKRVKQLDPGHPLVIIQAPRGTVADLVPYRPAFDITGADIYPISYPPGVHAGTANKDLSVVGDMTGKMVQAAGGKPVWMTLQIAWSGIAPSKEHPERVPRFPSLADERFMAYQAIVNGARGLVFFGGHMTQVMKPADAKAGWNWTMWELVVQPLLLELTSTAVGPALVAPDAKAAVRASASDVQLVARDADGFLYVIALRAGGTTSRVSFSGLPAKRDGTPIRGGQVLFEYVQDPLPPPIGGDQVFRSVGVNNGSFSDWFGPHDVHVYRFGI